MMTVFMVTSLPAADFHIRAAAVGNSLLPMVRSCVMVRQVSMLSMNVDIVV